MTADNENDNREELTEEVSELQQQNPQGEPAKEKSNDKLGIGAIIGIIIFFVIVLGGGYWLGRHVLHFGLALSIIAGPVIFAVICVIIALADKIGILDCCD